MQADPRYPAQIHTKEFRAGTERHRHHQRDMAVQLTLALHQQFTMHGDVLEKVEDFWYLGRLLSQDDKDIQAVQIQLPKAHRMWTRIG